MKKKTKHIRLNKMTSEGQLILSAKCHKRDDSIVQLYITDFINVGRVTIDVLKEIMLHGTTTLSDNDIKMVCRELKNEKLSLVDKVKNAIIFGD